MDPNSTDPRQASAVSRQRLRLLATTAAPSLPYQVLELAWTDILVGDAGERPGPAANDDQASDQLITGHRRCRGKPHAPPLLRRA